MRALILSSLYAQPNHRGKLRALAGLGVELMVALPGGEAGLDGGVRFTPIPVSGESGSPEMLRWSPGAIRRLLSDFVPIEVNLRSGRGTARIWTCDFTADYVDINASYRT